MDNYSGLLGAVESNYSGLLGAVTTLIGALNSTQLPAAPPLCADGARSSSPSLLRDLIQISVTVVATCVVLAVHRSRRGQDAKKDAAGRGGGRRVERTALMGRQRSTGKSFRWDDAAAAVAGDPCGGAFLSSVVDELWEAANVAVSNQIKETLAPLLGGLRVPVRVVKLDLGDVPLRAENMTVRPRAAAGGSARRGAGGGVQIDLDVAWDGHPDVMLQAALPGLGDATSAARVAFGVNRIKLSGRMHILLSPLTTVLPVVAAVQFGFTNPPEIELEFAGFAKSIAKQFSFVEPAITSIVQSSLAEMLVLPYRM